MGIGAQGCVKQPSSWVSRAPAWQGEGNVSLRVTQPSWGGVLADAHIKTVVFQDGGKGMPLMIVKELLWSGLFLLNHAQQHGPLGVASIGVTAGGTTD